LDADAASAAAGSRLAALLRATADGDHAAFAELYERFLTNPRGVVPGTRMGFAGIADAGERADPIAFLKAATRRP
jgi:cytochrome c